MEILITASQLKPGRVEPTRVYEKPHRSPRGLKNIWLYNQNKKLHNAPLKELLRHPDLYKYIYYCYVRQHSY